jgi:hypothetical protein
LEFCQKFLYNNEAINFREEKLERFAAEKGIEVAFSHLAIEEADIITFDAATQLLHAGVGERALCGRHGTLSADVEMKATLPQG